MGLNSCMFVGNVCRRPSGGVSAAGGRYLRFSMMVDERVPTPGGGPWAEEASVIDCVAFGRLAEELGWYLHVGTQVAVRCRLRNVRASVRGTDVTYDKAEFVVTSADVGRQPRRVRDEEWWDRV